MSERTIAAQPKAPSQLSASQNGLLQRQCACGAHTTSGGACVECSKKKLSVQRKLTIGASNDPLEQEADRIADEVLAVAPAHTAVSGAATRIQRSTGQATGGTDTAPTSVVRALASSGRPLDPLLQQEMGQRFGQDFSRVKVHADGEATNAANAIGARAYTVGHDIVFASGEYVPTTMEGKRLIAHELAHVVQQRQSPQRGVVMRQLAAQQARVRPATVEEAAEFLEEMARYIEGARSFALSVVGSTPGTPTTPAARKRAHSVLNQQRLRDLLSNGRKVFAAQESALQGGDPHGTRLRRALLAVIEKTREAMPVALSISDGMPGPTPDDERRLNAELVVEIIEADPFTSVGLLGTSAFGAAETAAGTSHEAFIEAYLDDLIRTLPGQTLVAADRDRILDRINAGLRRAFLTVATGPAGTVDVRSITNPRIVEKYRHVGELLSAGMSVRPAQLSIITDSLPAYVLPPDPVPDVTPQLQASPNIGTLDFSRVPAIELPYVRHGVLQAANTVFPATSTIQLRNASWPVALQVRRGGNIVRVRYDLIFDANSNVRVERLG
ncbi:MAG: DUF4157 domain-containing protein, partial [Gammaproteobacteria bacterium]|nr:DUF4157 domain-containing protein [Gammaproteobacteria bacterium]